MATSLTGCTILVIEDEPMIALDIAAVCENAGATALVPRSCKEAEQLIEAVALSAAVVDFRLWNGNANKLCDRLKERGIPFVMHSAFTVFEDGNDAVIGAMVLAKPARSHGLVEALQILIGASRKIPA